MLYSSLKLAVLSLLAAGSAAKTVRIDVGRSGKTFSPDSVTADRGDTLEFHFSGSKHSVVAGDFDKACSPLASGGFYSGTLQAKGDDPSVFQVNVTSTDPIFYYCSVGNHCKDGMVGVVNPSQDRTLDKFRSNAKSAGGNVSPPAPFGGKAIKPSESTATASGAGPRPTNAAGHLTAPLVALGGAAVGAAALLA
ncbi:hypothetical protein CDD83_4228 [Cordyceps sp. RAO-2017]|nr:hypothetical protein CDD83_4228 [Cordyceps sp. RAO-2017]